MVSRSALVTTRGVANGTSFGLWTALPLDKTVEVKLGSRLLHPRKAAQAGNLLVIPVSSGVFLFLLRVKVMGLPGLLRSLVLPPGGFHERFGRLEVIVQFVAG